MLKDLYKDAHKLTKSICDRYDDIDYKFQFQLCLSYLSDNKVDKRINEIMKEVKVTKEEARLLDQVEYHYKNTLNTDENLNFRLWKRKGEKRVYITSSYIKNKTYVNLISKSIYDKKLILTF